MDRARGPRKHFDLSELLVAIRTAPVGTRSAVLNVSVAPEVRERVLAFAQEKAWPVSVAVQELLRSALRRHVLEADRASTPTSLHRE